MTEQNAIRLPIRWESDAGKQAQFVNHVVLAFDGTVYTLRFYQVLPPVEVAAKSVSLQDVDFVFGKHVSTIVLTPQDYAGVVAVMQNALAPFAMEMQGENGGDE